MRTRIAILIAAPALALPALVAAPVATSAPNDVIADYFVDGQLNGVYSVDDLRAALAFAQDRVGTGAQYSAFADIISEAITRDLAGTAQDQLEAQPPVPAPRTPVTPAPDPAATAADDGLPTPPPTDPGDQLPAAVPVMGFVALGLVAIGSLSAIWRRRRRR